MLLKGISLTSAELPKLFRDNPPIGRARHSVDILERDVFGRMFWGIRIFKTKRAKEAYIKNIRSEGYKTFEGAIEDVYTIVDKLGLTNP